MSYAPKRGRRRHTARELAERFGVSERTIRYAVAEERSTYEGRAQERRRQIIELHRQGVGVRESARRLGVAVGLVSMRLKEAREAGVDLSPYEDAESA